MFSPGGAFDRRNRVTACCVALLLGAFVSSTTIVTNEKQKELIQWITSAGESISKFFQSEQQQESQAVATQPIDPIASLTQAYSSVSEKTQSIWSFVSVAFLEPQKFVNALQIAKNFLFSLFDYRVYSEIFNRLDTKIKNIFELIFVSNRRKSLEALFSSDNWDKTRKVGGIFLGFLEETNKFLVSEPSLFSYLLAKFVGDPEKIVKGFEDVSKEMEKKKDNLSNKKGKYTGINQLNLPQYSLTLDWLDCVLESTWLWWRCSNDKSSKHVSISSETSNSLAKFFSSY